MNNHLQRTRLILSAILPLIILSVASRADAGSCSYSQSGYYSQGGYYAESGYAGGSSSLTLTKSSTVTGNASILGTISKGSGTFMIDHPLDPKNKLLYHSFVESPDAKNIYDGVAVLDKNGEVTVELPDYFFALNTDYRYLAEAMDIAMPNLHLAREIHRRYWLFGNAAFSIAGGVPNSSISWQIAATRRDPFIRKHPIIPEVDKDDTTIVKKGECIFEPLCK